MAKITNLEKITGKLADAVRGADLVIMDYPMDMIKDGLGIIAKEVKAETVIICFAVAFTKTCLGTSAHTLPPGCARRKSYS